MALGFRLNMLPEFMPGERIHHFHKWLWAVSSKSPPTFRVSSSLPLIQEIGFYVTDRRITLVGNAFRLLFQQFDIWFPGKVLGRDPEIFKAVSTGRNSLFGDYLEILSEDPKPHWYRSRELRLRLFLRDPGRLERLIGGLSKA
jgi:hypothetical protein